jgi:hypothetical protein
MSVIKSLAREHAAFAKLIERLVASAAGDEKTARRGVQNVLLVLLVLLSALDRHEKVEERVFRDPAYASREGARAILARVEAEHRELQERRTAFLETLTGGGDVPIARLRLLTGGLAEALLAHFRTEEERLWPHYERFSRSLDGALRRRLELGIQALEGDISDNGASLARFLEAGGPGAPTT